MISKRRSRGPGGTVCRSCRSVVDNSDLREIVKPGNTKGAWYCTDCATLKDGGTR